MCFDVGDKVMASHDLLLHNRRIFAGSQGKVVSKNWVSNAGDVGREYVVEFKCGPTTSLKYRNIEFYVPSALEQLAEAAE